MPHRWLLSALLLLLVAGPGGAFYEKSSDGYKVVPPTAGAIVSNLPEGGEEVKIGDQTYVKFGETYYQPSQSNGKNVYEVVQVKDSNG